MKVTLSAIGHSAQYFPGQKESIEVEVRANETLGEILERTGVAKDLFMFALVGEERIPFTYVPKDGDRIVLVSPIMGG